jgi:hypothetical protein
MIARVNPHPCLVPSCFWASSLRWHIKSKMLDLNLETLLSSKHGIFPKVLWYNTKVWWAMYFIIDSPIHRGDSKTFMGQLAAQRQEKRLLLCLLDPSFFSNLELWCPQVWQLWRGTCACTASSNHIVVQTQLLDICFPCCKFKASSFYKKIFKTYILPYLRVNFYTLTKWIIILKIN